MNATNNFASPQRQFRTLLLSLVTLVAMASCSSSSSDGEASTDSVVVTEVAESSATSEDSASSVSSADSGPTQAIVTIDGHDQFVVNLDSCSGQLDSISFAGKSDAGTMLDVQIADGSGSIFMDGPEASFEGQTSTVSLDEMGSAIVTATLAEADDASDTSAEITIEATGCSISS